MNNKLLVLILGVFLLGCASRAPELPDDYSSMNKQVTLTRGDFSSELLELSCVDIQNQLKALDSLNESNVNRIKSSRSSDQTKGFVSALLFSLLFFAIDNHADEKSKIEEVYRQKDILFKLKAYKNCN